MKTLLTAVVWIGCLTASVLSNAQIAPPFALPILGHSQQVKLSEFNGKVVYLDFWASWCGPCRISIPQIVKLQEELGSNEFAVLAVNVDEDPELALAFLNRNPVNYTVLSDPDARVAKSYKLPGMPTSFVINKAGEISMTHVGFKRGDMAVIRKHIEGLLGRVQ